MKPKENRLIVADSGWAETIPEWILEAIKTERLIGSLGNLLKPGVYDVGDAEVLAYLYTANLRGNISHEHSEIFIYLTGKCMIKYQKIKEEDLPDFVREKLKKGLSQDEEYYLNILKQDLFRVRGGEIYSPLIDALKSLKSHEKTKMPKM